MMKNVYSVGQVNTYIKNMFAQDFMLKRISVKGEVSNCKYHSTGHIYFTLKDGVGAISAVMFAGNRRGLTFAMKEGDKVVVTGSIEVYERDGKYQLYAREIELAGAGNLYLKFEALKRELEEMGMFDASYKKPIPKYAKRVGIVTAPTGAAIQDIRNIASRRNPYVQLILYPALVQGEGAAASVVNGIRTLDALGVDVMIVGRGGGSIEDLWAFNEEIVARAIFACETPVISAVGHETDTTIADYAADLRAPTPSAAAELAVFDYALVKEQIAGRRNQFGRLLRSQLGAAYAKRVGIVTAPTGAAIQDIRNIASRRNPYVQLILYPALVQGEGAAASVVNGIRALDTLGVDVMIVGRGGGSIEDLWAFNEEIVARAIFACETPVISAVGHETDTTIADYAADLRAPTPSAAAELAVFDYALVKEQIAGRRNQFGRLLRNQIGAARMRLSHIQTKIGYLSPMNKLRENRRYAAELQDRMTMQMQQLVEQRKHRLALLAGALEGLSLQDRMTMQMQQLVEQRKHRLALLAGALEGLSPIKKLSMGYSYVSDRDGNAVTDAATVKEGEQLKITLLHGALMAQVQEILKEQEIFLCFR